MVEYSTLTYPVSSWLRAYLGKYIIWQREIFYIIGNHTQFSKSKIMCMEVLLYYYFFRYSFTLQTLQIRKKLLGCCQLAKSRWCLLLWPVNCVSVGVISPISQMLIVLLSVVVLVLISIPVSMFIINFFVHFGKSSVVRFCSLNCWHLYKYHFR